MMIFKENLEILMSIKYPLRAASKICLKMLVYEMEDAFCKFMNHGYWLLFRLPLVFIFIV